MFFCAIAFGSGNWFREIPSSSSRQVPWSAASTNRIMCPTAKTTRRYTSESKEDKIAFLEWKTREDITMMFFVQKKTRAGSSNDFLYVVHGFDW